MNKNCPSLLSSASKNACPESFYRRMVGQHFHRWLLRQARNPFQRKIKIPVNVTANRLAKPRRKESAPTRIQAMPSQAAKCSALMLSLKGANIPSLCKIEWAHPINMNSPKTSSATTRFLPQSSTRLYAFHWTKKNVVCNRRGNFVW